MNRPSANTPSAAGPRCTSAGRMSNETASIGSCSLRAKFCMTAVQNAGGKKKAGSQNTAGGPFAYLHTGWLRSDLAGP